MTETEFLNLFKAMTEENLPVYKESAKKRPSNNYRKDKGKAIFYSPQEINYLIAALKKDHFMPEFRFVIDKDGHPFFGNEGAICGDTPGHEEMCQNLCRAAGTLVFDHSSETISHVKCSSGFFKPSFHSLYWICKYLFSNDAVLKLASPLTVVFMLEEKEYEISLNKNALQDAIVELNLKFADFTPDVTQPYAMYPECAPKKYLDKQGRQCSPSCENLPEYASASSVSLAPTGAFFAFSATGSSSMMPPLAMTNDSPSSSHYGLYSDEDDCFLTLPWSQSKKRTNSSIDDIEPAFKKPTIG